MVRFSEIQKLGTPAVIPKTMRLTDFNNMGVSQNPVAELNPTLTQEEQPIKEEDGFFSRVDLGVQKGTGGTTSEVGKALYYMGDLIRNNQTTVFGTKPLFPTKKLGDRIANAGLRMYFKNQETLKKKFDEEDGEFDFAEALGRGAVSLAAALGLGLAAGPAAAGVAFGVSAKNEGFIEARKQGREFKDADRISTMLGFAEGGLEFVGINQLMKSSGSILLRAGKGYIIEFSQEFSQEVAGGTIRFAEGLREFKGRESLINLMTEGLQAGSVGGILGSGASVPISISQREGIKDGFKEMGATDQQASQAADEVMQRGMDDVMATVEQMEQEPIEIGPPTAEQLAIAKEAQAKKPLTKITPQEAATKEQEREVKKQKKAVVVAQEVTQKVKAIDEKFKTQPPKTKGEVKVVQEALIAEINRSELEANDKAKFISKIKNTQTAKQLQKALPEVLERVQNLEDKAVKRGLIQNFKQLTKKADVKALRPEFQKPVQEIIDQVTSVKPGVKKIGRLKSLAEFLEREPDNEVPQAKLNELKLLGQKPLADFSVQELEDVVTSVQTFVKLNALKNKILVKNKLRDFKEIETKAEENILKNFDELEDSVNELDTFQQIKENGLYATVKSFLFGADSLNAEYKTEELDNEDNGVIQQIIYRDIADGAKRTLEVQHEAEDFFDKRIGKVDMKRWSKAFVKLTNADLKSKAKIDKKIDTFDLKLTDGRKVTMTIGEKISLYLHSLNVNNTRHLINGGFNFTTSPQGTPIKLTQADLLTLEQSLTVDEAKVADAMSEYLNTVQKENINRVSVDLLGKEIATELNYWMIRTNLLDVKRSDKKLFAKNSFAKKTLEGLGIFKERQASSNAIILEDAFTAILKNIQQTSSYVGLASPLRGAKALLASNKIQKAMINVDRKSYLRSLNRYIEQVEGDTVNIDNFDRLTQELINKLDAGILGLNPYVMLKQPISYMLASSEMDVDLVKDNFKASPTKAELAEMSKHSVWIRDRLEGNVTREMGEVSRVGRVLRFFLKEEVVSQRVMAGIRRFDQMAIASIWRATKAEIRQKNPGLSPQSNEFFRKVDERSWEIIRRTQPTFHVVDRSTIGASTNLALRLMTKYSSQRNKNWIATRRAYARYNRSNKTPRDRARVASTVWVLGVISPLMLIGIDRLRDIIYSRERQAGFFKAMTLDYLKVELGNIYILGDLIGSLTSKIERGTYAGFDLNNVASGAINDMITIMAEFYTTIEQRATNEKYKSGRKKGEAKWKSSVKRFGTKAIDWGGRISGINISTIRKTLKGLLDNVLDLTKPKKGKRQKKSSK